MEYSDEYWDPKMDPLLYPQYSCTGIDWSQWDDDIKLCLDNIKILNSEENKDRVIDLLLDKINKNSNYQINKIDLLTYMEQMRDVL